MARGTGRVDMNSYPMYIGGEFREKDDVIWVEDPFKEEFFAAIPRADSSDLEWCLAKARSAHREWQKITMRERGHYLSEISKIITDNLRSLAEIESKEIGKAIKESLLVDVPLAAACFDYYGSLLTDSTSFITSAQDSAIDIFQYIPFGVAAIYLPYNVPLMIFGFHVAAALAAGNAVIVKPSEFGSLSVLTLAKYLQELDLPHGLINFITGEGPEIGAALAASDVDIISFTGSEKTVCKIMARLKKPKKMICELGGANIAVILEDANLHEAVENILASAFMKQGQMCIGTSIVLVEKEIYDDVLSMLVARVKKLRLGDPLATTTHIGPLRSKAHLERLIEKIKSLMFNSRLVVGGYRPPMRGYFLEPTLIEIDELIYEECFGPLVLIKRCCWDEIKDAIYLNPTGLTLQIWTRDLEKAQALAMKTACGTVWVNTFAQMNTSTPFGGCKRSGWGRALGKYGLYEYLQLKHIGISFGKSQSSGWFG